MIEQEDQDDALERDGMDAMDTEGINKEFMDILDKELHQPQIEQPTVKPKN